MAITIAPSESLIYVKLINIKVKFSAARFSAQKTVHPHCECSLRRKAVENVCNTALTCTITAFDFHITMHTVKVGLQVVKKGEI